MIAILIYLKTGNHGNIRFGCAYQILAYVISVMLSLAWYSTQRKFNLNNTSGWNIWSLLQRDALFGVHALYSNRKLLIDDFERFHSISVSFHSRVSIVDTTKRGNRAVWHLISNWTSLAFVSNVLTVWLCHGKEPNWMTTEHVVPAVLESYGASRSKSHCDYLNIVVPGIYWAEYRLVQITYGTVAKF